MSSVLAVALGGAVGAVARWASTRGLQAWLGPAFPWGTLFVNVVGCFALAYIAESLTRRGWASPALRDALTAGLLGAFTTFSTFGVDTWRAWERGAFGVAAMNVLANVALGLGACALGAWWARS